MELQPISMGAVLDAVARIEGRGKRPDRLALAPGYYLDTPVPFTCGFGARVFGLEIVGGEENAVGAYEREPRRLEVVGRVWEPVA